MGFAVEVMETQLLTHLNSELVPKWPLCKRTVLFCVAFVSYLQVSTELDELPLSNRVQCENESCRGCKVFTCGQVDHGCCACCDGVHLGVDFMLGFIHFVPTPSLGCLQTERKKTMMIQINAYNTWYFDAQTRVSGVIKLTASVPSGGSTSRSSREACAAWTACMLELMVPVRACCAEVCRHKMNRMDYFFILQKIYLYVNLPKIQRNQKCNVMNKVLKDKLY